MSIILAILGIVALLLGVFAIGTIRSDIQLIVALVAFGFGITFMALAALNRKIDKFARN